MRLTGDHLRYEHGQQRVDLVELAHLTVKQLAGVAVVSFLAFERHGVDSEKITRPAGIIASLPQYCLREFPANAAVLKDPG
jgi:hypothetical protein